MPDPLLYWKAMGIAATTSVIVVMMMVAMSRSINENRLNLICIVGIGVGLVIGNAVLALNLSWPPHNGLDRLLLVIIPTVLIVELFAGVNRFPPAAAWSLRIILSLATPRILLHDSVYLSLSDAWPAWRAITTIGVCGLGLALAWSLLSWLSRRRGGISISFALCLAIQCSGAAVMLAGYIKGGAAAIPFVATLLAVTIALRVVTKTATSRVKIEKPDHYLAAGIVGIGVVSLFGLLFVGHFFGDISQTPAITMLFAPLLCWVTEIPPLRNRRPWFVASCRLALVAIPLIIIIIAAKRDFDREMSPLLENMSSNNRTLPMSHQLSQKAI
jgi:hypothetical protein